MGIETTPNGEEPTEPPICGLRKSFIPPTTAAALNCEQSNVNKWQLTESGASHNLSSNTHQHATQEHSEGSEDQVKNAHLLNPTDLATFIQTDLRNGLSDNEADLRLKRDGLNAARNFKGISIWAILLRQVSNSLTIVGFAIRDLCPILRAVRTNC